MSHLFIETREDFTNEFRPSGVNAAPSTSTPKIAIGPFNVESKIMIAESSDQNISERTCTRTPGRMRIIYVSPQARHMDRLRCGPRPL